jgi:hypothetical protein
VCLFIPKVQGQDTNEFEPEGLRELISEIAERTENESVTEELANTIYDLTQHPIGINSAKREELESLFWLKDYQIDQIQSYVSRFGPLGTIFEITYIPGLSNEDVQVLKHFIVIDAIEPHDSVAHHRKPEYLKQQLLLRSQRVIEPQDGYREKEIYSPSNHYLGNPWKYYVKYNIRKGDKIQAGFTCEKDAGEEFFTGSNRKGFDYYSFHLLFNKISFVKTVVIGDYSLQFGQGLVMNSKYSFGKSASVFNATTTSAGINRYSSSDENNFFRGIATTLTWKNMDLNLFYSRHRVDANASIVDSTNSEPIEISSLQTSGIHGTPNEISDEKSVQLEIAGTHMRFMPGNMELGFTALLTNLSAPLNPKPELYNTWYFRGKQNLNFGFNYRWRIQNLLFFGEEAVSKNGGIALLNGLQYYTGSRFALRIIHRHYEKEYQSLFSNAFGENTQNQNEDGFFTGIECNPVKHITLAAFTDFFRFPWLRYQADMPSSGSEYMVQVTYKPNQQFTCYIQYKNKTKEENLTGADKNKNLITAVKTNRIKGNISYKINNNMNIQNRVEFNTFSKENSGKSHGIYISHDLGFSFNRIPVKFYLRYALFDTQSYDSRIFAYENDVLYAFSVPAYFDRGSRSYIMAKFSPGKNIDCWIKYSVTQYAEKPTISSGLAEIQGNKKSEIRIQLLLKFGNRMTRN